ncbi:MAG: sugar ABC transporter substrate-binding protein [Gemmiger sp.]
MKKALALMTASAMALSLAACGGSASTASSTASSASSAAESVVESAAAAAGTSVTKDNIKFGFLAPTLQTEFFINIDDGLKQVAAEDGWDYTSVSFENDSGTAVTDIENMVTSGCNVILAMVSDSSCDDALRAAQEAGTIVIECGVVTDVYDVSVNSSQYDIGTMISDMAGEWINTQLDGKANIVVYTTYQNQDMQNRGQGIQDRIKELCPDSNILEVVDIGKDVVGAGTTYTETMIQKYPELNCILAYGDAAATEAVEAVKAAGMNSDDFGIFACDGTESAIKYIADNDVMRGTLMFNSMAEMVRTALYQYLDGELEKGAVVDYSITPITVANVADYVK